MRKLLLLIMASTALYGCGSPVDGSSSSSSSSIPSGGGDAVAGKATFQSNCASCHAYQGDGVFGSVAIGGSDGSPFSIKDLLSPAEHGSVQGLASYISANMPYGNASTCVGTCADNTAEFMASKMADVTTNPQAAACSASDPVTYGVRTLRPLTASEYRKTVAQTGIITLAQAATIDLPGDVVRTKSNYAVHSNLRIEGTRATAFDKAAFKIADLATPNLVQSCGNNATNCADKFLQLAFELHRQPLEQDEIQLYRKMFTDFGATSGMRTALAAALTSPQFLYRSEMGITVREAKEKGWSTGGASGGNSASGYVAGSGGTTVTGPNFSSKSTGELDSTDNSWNLYSDGNLTHNFNIPSPAYISLVVRANDFDNQWPNMTVTLGNKQLDQKTVTGYDLQTFNYVVTDVTGNQQLQISFSGDQGREPYGTPGNDKNLYINKVTVSQAIASTGSTPTPATGLDAADPDAYVLTPYEFASQLAFMYTGTGPSKALLQRADSGGLSSDADVQEVINQLIASPAGRAHVEEFGGIWFRADDVVDESRPSFNQFTPQVAQDMATEVRKLFAEVWYGNHTLEDLYAGDFTVVNSRLAQFYGYNNFSGGVNDWKVANIPNRGGIMTAGAFHAAYANDLHTRPILKAVRVRELMLCHHVGAPQNMLAGPDAIAENQASIVTTLRDHAGSASAREYYEAATVASGCQVCHATQINPLFGIDDFDQIGRYRTSQTGLRLVNNQGLFEAGNSGVSVDQSGELIGLSDLNDTASISFNGAKDLGKKMASLPAIASCMVTNSFRFTTGLAIDRDSVAKNGSTTIREDELTDEQAEDYACAKDVLLDTYETSGKKPLEVYRKIGTLDLVRFRK